MLIIIQDFKGQVPAVDASLLPENFAQTAKNCDLRTGRLIPLKDIGNVITWGAIGAVRSIYKEEGVNRWLYWTESDISVVKAQLAAADDRLFYTGDGYPKQTNDALMPASGKPDATDDYRRLGVTPPAITLTINGPYGTGDGETAHSISYYYTYVVKWADGTEEESKPVAATAVIDIEGGEYVAVSGFVKPVLATSGNDVTHFRVYRLESGTSSATYQLAKMRPAATGATAVYDLPVAAVPADTTLVYDCNSVPDDLNNNLGEICPTEDWNPPPDDLVQLGQYQNGILGGFSGNYFYVSEPLAGYAWNTANRISLNYEPVAWGFYKGMAIIATKAFPEIVIGADSSTLMRETLPYNQGCLSARGFVVTHLGALYPSPDGLVLINETGVEVLTRKVLTKEQWADLPATGKTHADLVSFYYDNMYIGFWQGSLQGFIFNFKDNPYITVFTLTTQTIYHGCIDPTDDTLYLLTYFATDGYFSKSWEGATTYLTGTFKSKKFIVPNSSFSCARIIGNQSVSVTITLKIYGDGTQIEKSGATWTKTVTNTDIFALPLDTEHENYEIEVSTKAQIDKFMMANSPEEIIEGMGI